MSRTSLMGQDLKIGKLRKKYFPIAVIALGIMSLLPLHVAKADKTYQKVDKNSWGDRFYFSKKRRNNRALKDQIGTEAYKAQKAKVLNESADKLEEIAETSPALSDKKSKLREAKATRARADAASAVSSAEASKNFDEDFDKTEGLKARRKKLSDDLIAHKADYEAAGQKATAAKAAHEANAAALNKSKRDINTAANAESEEKGGDVDEIADRMRKQKSHQDLVAAHGKSKEELGKAFKVENDAHSKVVETNGKFNSVSRKLGEPGDRIVEKSKVLPTAKDPSIGTPGDEEEEEESKPTPKKSTVTPRTPIASKTVIRRKGTVVPVVAAEEAEQTGSNFYTFGGKKIFLEPGSDGLMSAPRGASDAVVSAVRSANKRIERESKKAALQKATAGEEEE